jgi:Cu(I)/Ag(I) efflux system membrane protein CusA/SilA
VIARVVAWCTRHSRIVVAAALVLALAGEWARRGLPRDAVPDLSDPQVGIVVDWMGHPAPEVAARVTQVLTDALRSLPGSTVVRGSSMSGMAYVDIVFSSPSDLERRRQDILDRVAAARARLPLNARVQVGPAASSTGWVFQYVLLEPARHGSSPRVQQFQESVVRPALRSIPGVAEVASVGEAVREVLVVSDPEQLRARGVAFSDVAAALAPVARGETNPQRLADASLAPATAGEDRAQTRVAGVGHVTVTADMPTGVADFGGALSTVGGIVVARRDADPKRIIESVQRTLDGLRPRLPAGVRLETVYDRLDLANRVEGTLLRALGEEVAVVAFVILMFLLHGRSAVVPLVTLPVVVLLTFLGMRLFGLPATIMSLGGIGIALGMAVDADVVALEACHRRLERVRPGESAWGRRQAIVTAAGAFAPAILTSLFITALSFLPVFAFTGETGRLLRPLALTKTLVIVAAAFVTLTLAPALRDRMLRGRLLGEFDNPITTRLVRLYRPFVHFALARPALTLTTALLAVLSCLPIVGRLGGEFLPRVDEGDLLFMPTTLPGVPAGQAAVQLREQDEAIGRFPEVESVFGKVGRADTATDPAPFSMIETTIRLRPRSQWPMMRRSRFYSSWAPTALKRALGLLWPEETRETTAKLVEKLDRATRMPGWTSAWTAPARARMDMMSTGGVRVPVGLRVFAASPARLDSLGTALQAWATRLPGTRSAVFESLGGEPWLTFAADPAALALHGVNPAMVQSTVDLMTTGGQVGEIQVSGQVLSHGSKGRHEHGPPTLAIEPQTKPYRVRVATDMGMRREDADRLRELTVRAEAGGPPVPLALLGHPTYVNRPAVIRTEGNELAAYVYVDLDEGTDVSSYVRAAQASLEQAEAAGELRLEPGERIEWTGQYQLMAAGERRLKWIVPFVVASMLALLFLQFRSLTEALIVLVSVPFALVGSFWTLFLLQYPMSAPVWVGLLSTVGLAMQTGVVMVVYIDDAFHRRVRQGRIKSREDIVAAHAEGTIRRLRPKVMTITTMAAGLLPLLWADGAGAEIMKRVAAPMLGGLATSAFLTLEVLPVLYTIWRYRQLRQAQRVDAPIESVVGAVPAWASNRRTPVVDQGWA